MQHMKRTLSICCLAMGALLWLYGMRDNVAYGLVAFAFSPYLFSILMLKVAQSRSARNVAYSSVIFLLLLGFYLLVDTVQVEEIIKEKLSYLVVPVGQWVLLLFLFGVVWLSNDRVLTREE